MMHLLSLKDFGKDNIEDVINMSFVFKKRPLKYRDLLRGYTLLLIFEKPSLRTRISFEVAMGKLGGDCIFFDEHDSPMGIGKESLSDTAKVVSRYVDVIAARFFEHEQIEELAKYSTVPIINSLTNFSHPCQIIADLMTIKEKKGKWKGLKLAYLGDGNNNVTHSLLYGCSMFGVDIDVICPKNKNFMPLDKVVQGAKRFAEKSKSKVVIGDDLNLVKNADVVYTDTWMSYHIPKSKVGERIKILKKFQVNEKIMKMAKKDAIFMHCLPATRGNEVGKEVIDGKQSIVFDQAENRMHTEKSIMLKVLGKL